MNRVKRWIVPILLAILIVGNAVVLTQFSETNQKLVEQRSMTIETKNKLQVTSKSLETIQKDNDAQATSLKEERLKSEALQSENNGLKAKKQARLEAASVQATPKKQVNAVAVTGTCADWLAQAGITDTANAFELIRRESGCNPNAMNKSSGACGVAQELPCGKSGCSLGDGACQVAWMSRYVTARYGSFAAAVQFHNKNNWY